MGQAEPKYRYKPYFNELKALVSAFALQIKDRREAAGEIEPLMAEWVLLKVIKRKWSEPRWTGPYKVVERTLQAVRLENKGKTWYHWSQCAACDEPQRSLREDPGGAAKGDIRDLII